MRRKAMGDDDEPIIIRKIIECRDQGKKIRGIPNNIFSVKDISLKEYKGNNDRILKSPYHAKADVIINNIGYSIKSYTGAPPTIINSTTREKFLHVCDLLNIDIKPLDEIIDEYWRLVLEDNHPLTFHNEDSKSPFTKKKNYLKRLILYFLFDGTGTGFSSQRASGIIFVINPIDINTYHVKNKEESFEILWPGMYWNMRKRFIDERYREMKDTAQARVLERWIRKINGFYYGELQLRAPILNKLKL